jgi:hypothetical protein
LGYVDRSSNVPSKVRDELFLRKHFSKGKVIPSNLTFENGLTARIRGINVS